MKLLSNLAGSYVTSDDVADAVMEYHGSLEALGAADLLHIPVLDGFHARLAPVAVGALTRFTVMSTLMAEHAAPGAIAELTALAEEWSPPQR